MKLLILGETGHGVSTTIDALVAQYPNVDIIVVNDIEKLQTRIEQHKDFINKIEPFIIESLPEHPFIEVRQPKPYIKVKKHHFDKHKFHKR